jgi:cysteine desulfurase/selenocysteine lyase
MREVGYETITKHEQEITEVLLKIKDLPHVTVLGRPDTQNRIGTVAFEVEGVHPHDVGQFIDAQGIEVRVGHHCAQPIHRHFGVFASTRASTGIYNTTHEAEQFVDAVSKVYDYFNR